MENKNTINTAKNNFKALSYEDVLQKLEDISINLDSYTDYPQAATNNAKKARKWKEENGSDCGTKVWDAWGGTSGIEWAIKKLKQIDKK